MRKIIAIILVVCSATLNVLAITQAHRDRAILFGGSAVAVVNITCSGTCWATVDCNNNAGCDATSTAQTVTNGTNSVLKFTIVGSETIQYSDNGGTPTTITNNGTITWTTTHTLTIKVTAIGCNTGSPTQDTVTVKDNVTGATVGTFIGKNTAVC